MSKTVRYDWRKPGRDPRREKRQVVKKHKRIRTFLNVVSMLLPFGKGTL